MGQVVKGLMMNEGRLLNRDACGTLAALSFTDSGGCLHEGWLRGSDGYGGGEQTEYNQRRDLQ